MRRIVLCDGPVRVELRTDGERMILSLDNSDQVEFALSQSNIKAVLAGETIQVSHRGIFCKLTRSGSIIHVYFAWKTRHEHVTCSADDLELLVGVADQQQLEA